MLALLDVPKIDVGAKAVADEVPNRPPPADVVVAVPREPNPTLATVETAPNALVVLVALPNIPPKTEVDEPSVVDEKPSVDAEGFVEAGLMFVKKGLAMVVEEKAEDCDPADKPNKLLDDEVVEGAITPVLDGIPNRLPGAEAVVVAEAPKVLVVKGKVLTVFTVVIVATLLLSDSAC